MDQDASWYGDRPRPTRHCVRWESSYLSPKGAHPQFGANVRCGQTAGLTKMPLGIWRYNLDPEATLCSMGRSYLPEKGAPGHPTQFLAQVYCGQRAGWIKMPIGTKVNVGSGDIVLDGVAAPPPKRGTSFSFRFLSIVAKRLGG